MDGERGTIEIHLKELLEKAGLSKNKFCQRAELQRSQLNGYLNNTITRLDIDVLIRICDALQSVLFLYFATIPPITAINSSGEGIVFSPKMASQFPRVSLFL